MMQAVTYRATATRFPVLLSVALLITILPARAATLDFGSFSLQMTEIAGSAAADREGFKDPVGGVAYDYTIGTYEIRESHIAAYNAAVAPSNQLTYDLRGDDRPATSISWFEAAHFVNFLNTQHGVADGAYRWNGPGINNFAMWSPGVYRNPNALYWLPNVDEWHKAAYGSPGGTWYDYPTGSDAVPTAVASGTAAGSAVYGYQGGPADVDLAGGVSGYGVMGMGGNVWEWEETAFDLGNDIIGESRGLRGGSWDFNVLNLQSSLRGLSVGPPTEDWDVGFRVAGRELSVLEAAAAANGFGGGGPGGAGPGGAGPVPEPSRAVLLLLGLVGMLSTRRRGSSTL